MSKVKIIQTDLESVAGFLAGYPEIFIIQDGNTVHLTGIVTGKLLNVKGIYSLRATEESKTFQTVAHICRFLMEKGAGRDAFVLGIGGGITSDMTGFASSVYKRGVKFGFIPTTLLSQVDAAIGGKNGVNLDSFKNMIGVIRQPEAIFICPRVLESLPREELVAGSAELLKTFIIDNEGGKYEKAVKVLSAPRTDWNALQELSIAAASVKAGIVERDEFESGERRLLNLGHTFAHAIEKISGESIPHGRAVGMGIILSARLSEKLGIAEKGLAAVLEKDFKACGLETACPFGIKDMAEAMKKDKKAEGGSVHFVLPRAIGEVIIHDLKVEDLPLA